MARSIRKTSHVEHDLLEIARYIAARNYDAAIRFFEAAEDAITFLRDHPGVGTRLEFAEAELADLRFWPIKRFRRYLIVYRPIMNGIEVVAVLHGARDIRRVLRERS